MHVRSSVALELRLTRCYAFHPAQHDDNLASTLKEVNLLEAQLSKDQKKLETVSSKKASAAQAKVSDSQRALSQTLEIWETEAPFAFEAYQRVDEQRLDLLRETVAKFETAQSDAAQRLMNITEQTMQVALSFDTQAEMSEFLLKNATAPAGGRGAPPPAPSRSRRESTPAVPPRLSGPPATPTIRTNGGSTGPGINEFGAASSSASIHSNGPPLTPQESTPGRGSTLKSALTRIGRGRSNKGPGNEPSSTFGSLPDSAEPMGPPSSESRIASRAPKLSLSNDSPATRRDENSSSAGLMAPMLPDAPMSGENSQQSTLGRSTAPQVDAEGYSIPPPDRKPWEVGGAGAPAGGASLMDDEDEDEQEQVADLPSKVTGMNISSKPIAEDSAQDQEALERMRSTLLTARSPAAGPTRRGTTRRDRRDVRNTAYMPGGINVEEAQTQSMLAKSGAAAGSGIGSATSPIPTQSTFAGQPGLGAGRSQSIVSMSSMNAAPGNPFEASSGPGLRASITETVNVIFAGRDVQRIMVVGEVAVSLRDIGTTEPLHLRLDSFEQLEKAAPNPAFLQPLGADKPGEYRLDVAALLAQGGASGAAQATLLKYQLHVSESRQREYIPLDVTAQWRCEAHQTSFLCNYAANPASRLAQPAGADDAGTATLQDLSFVVSVQPSNVTGQMSKPVGVWSAEHKRMYWRIADDVPLASAESNKVLGRFQVDAPSTPGPVQVRWRVAGRTISALGVSVVGDSGVAPSALRFEDVARSTSSGKYVANPV